MSYSAKVSIMNGQKLNHQEALQTTILNTLSEAVFLTNTKGQFVFVSQNVDEIFGYSQTEIEALKNIFTLIPDLDKNVLKAKQEINNLAIEIMTKDDITKTVLANIIPVEIQQGKFLFTMRDISLSEQAEDRLEASEKRFRALFEQVGDYCMILDPNTADGIPLIIDANDAACAVHGYTREEFIGRPVTDIDDEEGKRLVVERTQRIMSGKPFRVENNHVRKDGTTFPVSVHANRIDIPGEPPLIFTTEYDISERKLAEQKIEDSEERFRLAMETTQDVLWDWDLATDKVYYSPGWAKILGEEQIPKMFSAWQERIHPDDRPVALKTVQEHLENQTSRWEMEFRLSTKNGSWKWVKGRGHVIRRDKDGQPLRMIGTMTDIHERVMAEQALQENEALLSTIYNNSDIGVFLVEVTPQGEFIYEGINPAHEKLVGLSNAEVVGKRPEELLIPFGQESVAYVLSLYEECITKQEMIESEFYVPEGPAKGWWLSRLTPILDENGRVTKIIGSGMVTTELKEAQQAVADKEQKYRATLNAMQDAIHVIDADFNLILHNETVLLETMGSGLGSNILGRNLFDVYPFLPKSVRKEYQQVFKTQKVLITEETQGFDGKEKYSEIRKIPIVEDNKVIEIVTVIRDITERTKAERAIQESEITNRSLLQHARAGIGFYNLDGRLILFNELAIQYLGGQPEDYTGKSILEIFGSQAGAVYLNRIQQVMQTKETLSFEDHVPTTDGKKWFSSFYTCISDTDGNITGVIIVAHEITDLKIIQQELEKTTLFLEEAQKIGEFGSWDWNIMNHQIWWSDSLFEIFGHDRDAGIPPLDYDQWLESIHPDDRTALHEIIQTAIEQNIAYEVEYRIIRQNDGQVRTIHEQGKIISDQAGEPERLLGATHDITGRKKMEKSLRRIEFAFNHSADSIIFENQHGEILYANNTACKKLGYSHQELLDMKISDIDPDWPIGGDFEKSWNQIKELGYQETESRHQTKEGDIFPVELLSNFVEFEGEEYNCTFARDITQRKRFEEERLRLHNLVIQDANELEKRVQERTEQYQNIIELTTDREIRMAELKKVISQLRAQLEAAGLQPVADDPLVTDD
jgi:PAS domain S-box-containing protein